MKIQLRVEKSVKRYSASLIPYTLFDNLYRAGILIVFHCNDFLWSTLILTLPSSWKCLKFKIFVFVYFYHLISFKVTFNIKKKHTNDYMLNHHSFNLNSCKKIHLLSYFNKPISNVLFHHTDVALTFLTDLIFSSWDTFSSEWWVVEEATSVFKRQRNCKEGATIHISLQSWWMGY